MAKGKETEAVSIRRPPRAPGTRQGGRDSQGPEPFMEKLRGRNSRDYFLIFLGLAIVVQGLHVLEHISQSIQVFLMGIPAATASGLIGSVFDFPWVHFTYNFLFFGALIFAVAWAYGLGGFSRFDAKGMWALILAAALQTYHAAEHVIQLAQTLETGTQRPPGFIGFFANNVIVHLLLNLLVWLPVVFAFYRFGGAPVFSKWLASLRRPQPGPA